jgi:hypothetical protein
MNATAPDWDAMDFSAARELALSGGQVGASIVARDRSGDCALALVADARTGWLVIVLSDEGTGESFLAGVLDPAEAETRMRGSVAPADGQGPRLHYALARAESVRGLRMREPETVWGVREANSEGWAGACMSFDDFDTLPQVEILEEGAWSPLV